MANACADPLQAFGFRETISSMLPLYFLARKLVSSLAELFRRAASEEIFSSPWSRSLSHQSKNGNDALVIDVGHLRDRRNPE